MTNWTLAGEKPYNHGQQKKTLHHTKFGKECGETQEGCLGSQGEAAKVPEGYFSGTGVPTEQCGDWTPSWAPQPIAPEPERNPDNFQLWNAAGVLSAKEKRPEKQRASQRANTQNFVGSHLPWVPEEEGQSGLEMLEESLGLVAQRRQLKDQPPGYIAESLTTLQKLLSHAEHSCLNGTSLRGSKNPPQELLCSTLWCWS